MKKVLVLIWFCAMIVAAQAQVEKGVSSTGQLGTTGDTRSFVDEKGHIVTRPRLTRTGKIIKIVDGVPCVGIPTITDKDGNVYNTVQIGSQCWMRENLKTTHYADGIEIAMGSGESLLTPFRYYPDGQSTNWNTYGYLYNWAAVMHWSDTSSANPSGVQGICPDGWHVPSQAEWEQLFAYCGENYALGGNSTYIAKALADTIKWNTNTTDYTPGKNLNENNVTGFSAMPAGIYAYNGSSDTYNQLNIGAFYWSTTPMNNNTETYGMGIGSDAPAPFYGEANRNDGFSVRCVLGAGLPVVSTITADNAGNRKASALSRILSNGGDSITARGVCWSLTTNPTMEDSYSDNSISFTIADSAYLPVIQEMLSDTTLTVDILPSVYLTNMSGLSEEECVKYYVRAFATNSVGTAYGNEISFNIHKNEYAWGTGFGQYTIHKLPGDDPVWKNSNGDVVGHWDEGETTELLPVDKYELTVSQCGGEEEHTTTKDVLTSPICKVDSIFANEIAYTPSYSGKYIRKLKDFDNNEYELIQVGNQCWMRQNLHTTHYANGGALTWANNAVEPFSEKYYDYVNHDADIADTYGYLYNWSAVMNGEEASSSNPSNVQGICPEGWHVPSAAEFKEMTDYVSAQKDFRCNSNPDYIARTLAGLGNWDSSSETCSPGSNAFYPQTTTYFDALATGNHSDEYYGLGAYANFWTSTKSATEDNKATLWALLYDSPEVYVADETNGCLLSVRCVRGAGASCETTMDYTINMGNTGEDFGTITINSTTATAASWKDSAGVEIGTWVSGKTAVLPVGVYSVELTGPCGATTITEIRLSTSPICQVDSIFGNETAFVPQFTTSGKFISKMKDIDENEYNVLQMGKICWIRENLKTKTFSNGTAIQHGANKEVSNNIAYYEYPANDEGNVAKYGLLYNWPAAMCNQVNLDPAKTVQGVCPDGWHLLGGPDMDQLGDDFDISKFICGGEEDWMAKALSTTTDWNSSSVECAVGNDLTTNNTTGAAMLPAGYRSGNHYEPLGNNGFLWLALGTNTTGAINMKFYYDNPEADIPSVDNPRSDAYSVRCIRGKICDPAIFDYTINKGNSDDFGRVTINSTNAVSVSWRDTNGVEIGTWASGKTDVLPVAPYIVVLTNKCGDTSTQMVMILSSPICTVDTINSNETGSGKYISKLTDVDNNEYNVVQVLTQCWTRENLRAEKYADGTDIALEPSSSSYATSTRRYYPDANPSNVDTYGYLYNWPAAMKGASATDDYPHPSGTDVTSSGIQGVCPDGWHLPSMSEYILLTGYAIGFEDWRYPCNTENDGITVKALASSTGWNSSTVDCAVGNEQATNNAVGFAAMPAGVMDADPANNFSGFGTKSLFITTSAYPEQDNNVCVWGMRYDGWGSTEASASKATAAAVRCVRGAGTTPECETSMDYTINMGNSADFGRVTINSTNATSASWKDSNDVEIGTWVSGKTDILPVGKYTVELIGTFCNKTIEFEILSSPICTVESVNSNETGSNGQISQLKDVENHTYNVVQIGSQCWMKENMRSKTFAGGDTMSIRHITNDDQQAIIAHYDYPDSVPANRDTHGLLYTWISAMHYAEPTDAEPSGIQGICPDGWHIPSQAEFTTLTDYVSSKEAFQCGGDATKIGKDMAAQNYWLDKATVEAILAEMGVAGEVTECMPAYDLSSNNATGFSLVPAGNYTNSYIQQGTPIPSIGLIGTLWTSTLFSESGLAQYYVDGAYAIVEEFGSTKSYAPAYMSVRCVRGEGNNTPSVTTGPLSDFSCTSVKCDGNVLADGGSEVTARGVCWSLYNVSCDVSHDHTTDGSGTGAFTSEITGLTVGHTYYIRAYATNALGTSYGEVVEYTPTIEFDYTVNMGNSPDFGKVTINSENITTATWKNASNEVVGNWTSGKTDVLPVGTYSVEYTNTCGVNTVTSIQIKSSPICTVTSIGANETGSGNQISKLRDVDNNSYNVVQIGSQCFMKENLKTKHFADGAAIREETDDKEWARDILLACYKTPVEPSSNTPTESLGLLYSACAAMKYNLDGSDANPSGVQGICPDGWHVPSLAEFTTLYDYAGQQEEWLCGESESIGLGKALASHTDWYTIEELETSGIFEMFSVNVEDISECAIVKDVSSNNVTGLSLTPAGFSILGDMGFPMRISAMYWTTVPNVESSDGAELGNEFQTLMIMFSFAQDDYAPASTPKSSGVSVRCVRGDAEHNTPSVTTSAVSAVTGTTATCGGNVTFNGGLEVTARGICWRESTIDADHPGHGCMYPYIEDNHTTDGTGLGTFTSEITGLKAGTKYYVRAYATNALGTFYGDTVSFTTVATPASLPTVKILSAAAGIALGAIMDDGGATVTEKGVCWSTTPGASLSSTHAVSTLEIDTFNVLGFATPISGLDTCIKYYVRAYATNSVGTAYSDEVTVTQLVSSGIGGGYFGYSSNYGKSPSFASIRIDHVNVDSLAWKTRAGQYMGSWRGPSEVLPVGEYFIHVYTNCNGDWYGDGANQASYTSPELAALLPADPDKGLHVIPASPICTVTSINTANETAYSASYSGTYINKLTDKSGNEYDVVQIGEQCWMRENLRTTKFADGTDIDAANYHATDNVAVQGYVYDWSATNDATGICPDGWHVPSATEWTQLTEYLSNTYDPHSPSFESHYPYRCEGSDENSIAKSLASKATDWPYDSNDACSIGNTDSYTVWNGPDDPRTLYRYDFNNRTGFNAVPVGYWHNGGMDSVGKQANYWTSTGQKHMNLDYPRSTIEQIDSESGSPACSIRCLRD